VKINGDIEVPEKLYLLPFLIRDAAEAFRQTMRVLDEFHGLVNLKIGDNQVAVPREAKSCQKTIWNVA
jgi:hypothetical protein